MVLFGLLKIIVNPFGQRKIISTAKSCVVEVCGVCEASYLNYVSLCMQVYMYIEFHTVFCCNNFMYTELNKCMTRLLSVTPWYTVFYILG